MLLYNLFSFSNESNRSSFFYFGIWCSKIVRMYKRLNCALCKLLSFGAIWKPSKSMSQTVLWVIEIDVWQAVVITVVIIVVRVVITKGNIFWTIKNCLLLSRQCSVWFTWMNTVLIITLTLLFYLSFLQIERLRHRKISNLLKVTQLIKGRVMIWLQSVGSRAFSRRLQYVVLG